MMLNNIGIGFCVLGLMAARLNAAQVSLTTQALSAGESHGLSLRSDGTVWAWGTNRVGEAGLGTNQLILSPKRITSISNMTAIAAGPWHSLAVSSNGQVWAWGTNGGGRLGNGTFNNASNPVAVSFITNAIAVAAGANHSLAALSDGRVMAWGTNNGGQLGTGNTVSTNQPTQAGTFTNAIAVSAGTNHSLALTASGDVWAWGTNTFGQLGQGDTTTRLSPVKIAALSNIVQIAAGHNHGVAVDKNGRVFTWGRNVEGQLGDGTTNNATSPLLVGSFGPTNTFGAVNWIAANFNSSAAVSTSGRLFYWGWFDNGTTNGSTSQVVELGANSGQVYERASYGSGFLLASQRNGSVWGWGNNRLAQWGNGAIRTATDTWRYEKHNPDFSFSAQPHSQITRFMRGDREVMRYNSFVLPLDMEAGVTLDAEGSDLYSFGSSTPWFLQVKKTSRQHAWQLIAGSTNLTRFNVENPVVAFGSEAGGSPLYTGKPYTFGVYGGAFDEKVGQSNMIRVLVYDRAALVAGTNNVTPTNTFTITLPRRYVVAESNVWSNFITNGSRVLIETNGLRTSVEFADSLATDNDDYPNWGLNWKFAFAQNVVLGGYRMTHLATSTNYCYVIEVMGSVEVGTNAMSSMVVTNTTGWTYAPLYAIGFEAFPAWRSQFIDSPHYEGIPVPSAYTGRRVVELQGMTAMATNVVWLTNNPAYTNVDASPELWRHPLLDQLVDDMKRDPLALAAYVVNEIELCDPVSAYESGKIVEDSIELGGVNRSALGTFLEGQGSPTEQCALLVYLLRQAGYPAGYVFPTNNNLRLLDTTVSRLWQINVKGVQYHAGVPVVTNSLIAVNYPWVVANIGTNVVHIFPWMKNTEIVEGEDIYDFMPTNYPSAYQWVKDYALALPEIMALGDVTDTASTFWQRYLTAVLSTNQTRSNLSLDDFGVRAFNRRLNYPTWDRLPKPNFLTNQSLVAVVPTLSESATTYPFLTNIFDRVRIEIFKNDTNAANKLIDTGLWRASDLHNRKLLVYTNTASTAALWLAPYRTDLTNNSYFTNYESGTASLNLQMIQTNIAGTVTNLPVRVTHQRRYTTLASPASWYPLKVPALYSDVFTPAKRDVTAICSSFGRVTKEMMRFHAEDYWKLQQQRASNPNFTPAATDDAGTAAIMLGLGYFEKLWSDDQFNQRLHKVRGLTWVSWGMSSLTKLANGNMAFTLDMGWLNALIIGNARLTQDSTDRGFSSLNNYMTMLQANGSSAEHSIFASMFADRDAISTVRVLQLAAERGRSNSWAMPPELNIKNYAILGAKTFTGYGATTLRNQDVEFWQKITNVFKDNWDSNYFRILTTPGPVTNASGLFKGQSALVFGKWSRGAILSGNQVVINGGLSFDSVWIGAPTFSSSQLTYNLGYNSTAGFSFVRNNFVTATPRFDLSPNDYLTLTTTNGVGKLAFTPQQRLQSSNAAASLNLSSSSTTTNLKTAKDMGWLGRVGSYVKQAGSTLADPVQIVSGDFYADSTDLVLAGPMPLPLRRNYLSRNLADNQFGVGWKLSFTPWLVLITNAGISLIQAADVDGSVVAYRYLSNNLWTVQADDNPGLVNFTEAGIGSTANPFNSRIEQYTTNGTLYVLNAPDGSRRSYLVMTNLNLVAGTNYLNRIRPYLTRWEDHAGNFHSFSYGTNSQTADFGQLVRVDSANGAFLVFKYDVNGRILEAFTDDNRRVRYAYDTYGDLVTVTLPDDSQWKYDYDHYSFTTNSLTYTDSNHLLTQEAKPDGRLVANTFDSLRRVTTQAATVGTNRELVTNAWFYYTNNVTSLTNDAISGVTRVEDVFHNVYLYSYTNNLITRIVEPLGRTNLQDWFEASETNKAGYYPRSLELSVDARGLTNEFRYDSRGNLTNQIRRGDLTGDGVTSQSATNTFTFTTNNLPVTLTDPSGNGLAVYYDDSTDVWRPTRVVRLGAATAIATNRFDYTNVSEVITLATTTRTNQAFGLRSRVVIADSATNEWTFNGRGFPNRSVRYATTSESPGITDPPVINTYSVNSLGLLATRTDAAGRGVQLDYDAAGRTLWRDVFDGTTVLSRETFYYTRNGQLEWYDGPQTGPEDFIWFDHDGAGRKVQQIQWRSRARSDGAGVEAETGDALYATTFYRYDAFGNLLSVMNPRHAVTTNSWDALGRLVQTKQLDTDGATVLATAGFAYEPGGLLRYSTNALGGVAETQYTTAGQPKYRLDPDGSTNAWRYYLDGRLKRAVQRNGSYWETLIDDANRRVTRIFYSAGGTSLATNIAEFDLRGNLIRTVDASGFAFTNSFDGLGRLKFSAGPAIVIEQPMELPSPSGQAPPVQQAVTNFYDTAGVVMTNVNAMGEKTITYADALGRPTRTEIRASNNALVRESSVAYASDHHSITVTNGSGASAIVSTIFTDSDGQAVLSVVYPADGVQQLVRSEFDAIGNLASEYQLSSSNGSRTVWTTASYSYDGLNRLTSQINRDSALTTFAYDPAGNLTNRTMPGGLQWRGEYSAAGQLLKSYNLASGGTGTRTNTYSYFSSGNAFAGLLQTRVDGRNVSNTLVYDDWLRPVTNTYSGTLGEHSLSTAWQYDVRGLVTNIVESFASSTNGPETMVSRSYDAYGLLSGEQVRVGGALHSGAVQTWNSAGRRDRLGFSPFQWSFIWQADGRLSSVFGDPNAGSAIVGSYTYSTAGLLASRSVGGLAVNVTSRDGAGRVLAQNAAVNGTTRLSETLSWTGDGLLSAHHLTRSDFTDARSYDYTANSRRLATERLNLTNSVSWTNVFGYDSGSSGGAGVLTRMAEPQSGGAEWTATVDLFNRIDHETNNVIRRLASGRMNATTTIGTISVQLDGRPMPLNFLATGDTNWPTEWRTSMELRPGSHTLLATARHSSGLFSTNATATFTNNAVDQTTLSHFAEGQLSYRVWKNSLGQTNRVQTFDWDGKGRLLRTTEVDSNNNGYNWSAVYDALGRRLRTATTIVTNGIAQTNQTKIISQNYDPSVEFLEVGVTVGGKSIWKMHGPDLDGTYGGMNGTGGFEGTSDDLSIFRPAVSDARGNVHGLYDVATSTMVWNSSRPTGYGGVPEHRPIALADNGELASSSAWRGRWADLSGLYNLGARYYDPVAGRFISCDPLGHDSDPSLYAFASGDPINYFDPDGRFGKQVGNAFYGQGRAVIGFSLDTVNNLVYGTLGMGSEATGIGLDMVRTSTGLPIYTGDWFRNQANSMESLLSPYAKQSWYDPLHPLAQTANAYLIVVQPETIVGKIPATSSTIVREIAIAERATVIDAKVASVETRSLSSFDEAIPPGMKAQTSPLWQAQARAGTQIAKPTATRLGVKRQNPTDWRATRDLWDSTGYGEILSDANRAKIARSKTPVVDEAWIKVFPEDAGLMGNVFVIRGTLFFLD